MYSDLAFLHHTCRTALLMVVTHVYCIVPSRTVLMINNQVHYVHRFCMDITYLLERSRIFTKRALDILHMPLKAKASQEIYVTQYSTTSIKPLQALHTTAPWSIRSPIRSDACSFYIRCVSACYSWPYMYILQVQQRNSKMVTSCFAVQPS